ncbi:MAG TPA: BPSL0067 family protein [Stellaceae bacterium]|jgi:hypothetical protein
MSFVVDRPERWAGEVVANGHCVRFVQAAGGLPLTSQWRCGIKVRGIELPAGTVIATFEPNGRYGNHTDGRSHAAVYERQSDGGLRVWDQWQGHPVALRTIHFRGGRGRRVNDGDQFHVVETEATLEPPPEAA